MSWLFTPFNCFMLGFAAGIWLMVAIQARERIVDWLTDRLMERKERRG